MYFRLKNKLTKDWYRSKGKAILEDYLFLMSPFKTVLSFVIIALLGYLFISKLSVDLVPNTQLPVITVSYSLTDAPPEILEQQATGPLENALSQLSQIKKIYSVSGYGQGSIEITFDKEVDIAFKKFEVSSTIRQVYKKLNAQLSYPLIEQRNREDKSKNPLLVYRINAKLAPFQIRKTAEDMLVPALSRMKGVYQVALRGAQELQITLEYDHERLAQFGITTQSIISQIQTSYQTFYPGALLTSGKQRFTIKGGQAPQNLQEINDLQIRTATGQYVSLGKLTRVYMEESKPRQYFRINGLNSITITIYADEGVNRLQLANTVKEHVNKLESSLPAGFSVIPDYDDTEFLKKEIDKNIYRSLLSFGILLIFLLVSYRNIRHLLILFSGILISLGLTALVAFLFQIQIHLYTIAGLTISLGIIIDNSIVVLDHLKVKGDKKIVRAVLGGALTTIMALSLVFFLPEEDRQNLTGFCIIVSIAVACSVATAIFYTPALNQFYKPDLTSHKRLSIRRLRLRARLFVAYSHSIFFIARFRKSFITLCILAFGLPIFMLPSKWEGHGWYNETIGSTTYQETVRPYTDKMLGGALRLFVRNVYERNGYREAQRTLLYVNAELPHGNTLEDMNRVMEGMENYLQQVTGIDKYVTQVISGQQASIAISFTKETENSSLPFILKSRLIARSLDWGGVTWSIYGVGQGFSNSSGDNIPSFTVEMKGYNYDQLETYAETLAKKLLTHKRIQKVNTNERLSWGEKNAPQMVLNFNNNFAGNANALTSQLSEKAERTNPSTFVNLNNQFFPVYLKPHGKDLSTYNLLEAGVVIRDSLQAKLSSIASLRQEISANAIHKQNRQYIRMVGFEYFGSYQFGNEFLEGVLNEMGAEMQPGYKAKKNSWSWNWDKAKRQYGLVLILIIGVFFISAILFENLKLPFFIILTIPFSFIGIFLSFSLFDFYFDQGGYAAFIMLGGLVVNASIYIVNDFNNTIYRNHNRGVTKAVSGKMKPILLTIASTCLGLLPFMIGGQNEVFWFALAAGTTGGLIFSILVVFVVLPVLLIAPKYQQP